MNRPAFISYPQAFAQRALEDGRFHEALEEDWRSTVPIDQAMAARARIATGDAVEPTAKDMGFTPRTLRRALETIERHLDRFVPEDTLE